MKEIRIFLVDSHELIRRGVRSMLSQEEDMEIVGDFSLAETALSQVETVSPNIIIMDAEMPGIDGIEATRYLRQRGLACNVILLTAHQNYLVDALEAGVTGYLLGDIKSEDLTRAIRRVHREEIIIDQHFSTMPELPDWITDYLFSTSDRPAAWVREVDLLISPPIDAARLIRFINSVEEVLGASIIQEVGSWSRGTSITILLRSVSPQEVFLDKLAGIAEVAEVREKATPKFKALILTKSKITASDTSHRKKFLVTMRQFTRFDSDNRRPLPVGKSQPLNGFHSSIVLK